MRVLALLILFMGGCTHLNWTCPERPVFRLKPTKSSLICRSTDHSVDVEHPAAPKESTDDPYVPTR